MKKHFYLKSLLSLMIMISVSAVYAQKPIAIEKLVLDNGLSVFLHEDHTKAEVFGVVITKAGGKNDPENATGMAHYQEHMLFKGTQTLGTKDWAKEKVHIDKTFELYDQLGATKDEEKRAEIQKQINEESLKAAEYAIPNELSNVINSMGGTNLNAGTGPDNTLYYNAFPPNQIERWLDLYSHRFINPVFRSFQAELEVVYEEKNMYQDMFIFPLIEKFNFNFFKNHPYGQQTLIGTVEDLKNPSLTQMYDFFKTYYVANNMALVISGDFNTREIIPIIKEKFGRWESGQIPEKKIYEEAPFEGREFIEAKMSPIKLAMLGFRTVPNGHPDETALEVCNQILSNGNSTGMLDKLSLDNKILAAQVLPMKYNDHASTIFLVIPKLFGQKLEDAEEMVMAEIEKLKKGEFEEWMIEAVKNQLYKSYVFSMESNQSKALQISNAFGIGVDIDEYLRYPEKVKSITKEEILRVANKYYGDNYLAFHSKMGFPKKDKIEKPGYEALKANTNAKSEYVKAFEEIPVRNQEVTFTDFNKDIKESTIPGGKFYSTKNPVNDIFTYKIKFGVGEFEMPMLKYAAGMIDLAGTEDKTVSEVKNEFSKLGCNYSVYSNNSYLVVSMNGIEKNFEPALKLLNELITKPKLDQSKIDILVDGEKTERKMERTEADNVAEALFNFVKYGMKSPAIDRLSMKEIKALQADSLVKVFKAATQYEKEIHYVGTNPKAKELSLANIQINENAKPSNSPIEMKVNKYDENVIYFVHKKKALQSKIYFFANGKEYKNEDQAEIDAFNSYFGGGFSGLVLQEVREYRSLAYSAGAGYSSPRKEGNNTSFTGYIGTQADKTSEGLEVFHGLVRNMLQKPERMQMISDYLIQSAISKQPGFRNRSEVIQSWKLRGYDQDPTKILLEQYKTLDFNNIVQFWESNIKDVPMVIAIVGNKKSIDMEELEKYGKIVYIKEKSLFSK